MSAFANRDAATRLIGRGEDKRFNAEEMENKVLLALVDDLFSGDSVRAEAAVAVLLTNKSIARHLLNLGLLSDERHARRHGARIRQHYQLLTDLKAQVSPTE